MVFLTTASKLTCALLVISPASTTRLSFTSVSAATREVLSCFRIASSTASEIWSATLSGWPSDTDSEVKRKSLIALRSPLGEGRKDIKFALFSDDAAASRRARAAPFGSCVGKRPRLVNLWDIAHVPAARAREPRGRALWRPRASPARDCRRGAADSGAAGALVSAARRGGRACKAGRRR